MWRAMTCGAIVLLCSLSAGCSFGIWGHMYNNRGAPRTRAAEGKLQRWPESSTIRVPYPGTARGFEVRGGGDVWRYDPSFPPDDRVERKPIGAKSIKLQLEPSGEIFIVDLESRFPVDPLPPQPVGFPLRPTR